MRRPDAEINAYLDGEPTPQQVQTLESWIQDDPANAQAFFRLIQLHQLIGDRLRKQRGSRALRLAGELGPDDSAAALALAELARLHEEGLGGPIDLEANRSSVDRLAHGPSRRTVVRARLIIAGGLAALFALGVGVALVVASLSGGTPRVVETPDATSPRVVATLTDQNSARWETEAGPISLETGDALAAGRRLTLTRGLAELTLLRGAVVTLEAPCTIELIDHDNALRLESGKLVGVVKSDRAKGFVVHTPRMDVTDLGTRFGIDASFADATEVHVYEGEVTVGRVQAHGGRAFLENLVQGQAMRASGDADGLRLVPIAADPMRFVDGDITPRSYLAASTGFGLGLGETDPNWRVVAVDGRPITEGSALHVVAQGEVERGTKLPGNPQSTHWLQIDEAITSPDRQGRVYTCRVAFRSPDAADLRKSDLVLGVVGGRAILAVRINGEHVDIPDSVRDRKTFYTPYFELRLNPSLAAGAGTNTVEIDVFDTDTTATLRAAFEVRPTQN